MWTYGLLDYDPERDGDEEEWARRLAEQAWRTWDADAVRGSRLRGAQNRERLGASGLAELRTVLDFKPRVHRH